ncbi:MAG: HEPN domain-containing protein, partial [Methylobacteriaceae bacterium]|nr:HEPN domain-containing protein [Methylobacteriaceae bacterium]
MPDPSSGDLKALADTRLSEAMLLLEGKHYSGAYYLAGYAVECGIKAIIAASFKSGVIPSGRFVERVYSHDLKQLMALAGLSDLIDAACRASSDLEANWALVALWSEASRYEIIDPSALP